MAHPGRNIIYEATIRRMVSQALDDAETAFCLAHSADSDGQLLRYLQESAASLGHTPWPREIVGGSLLETRFGTWENALAKAALPKPTAPDRPSGFLRIREETQRQKLIYRQKKAEKKLRAQQRLQRE